MICPHLVLPNAVWGKGHPLLVRDLVGLLHSSTWHIVLVFASFCVNTVTTLCAIEHDILNIWLLMLTFSVMLFFFCRLQPITVTVISKYRDWYLYLKSAEKIYSFLNVLFCPEKKDMCNESCWYSCLTGWLSVLLCKHLNLENLLANCSYQILLYLSWWKAPWTFSILYYYKWP